MWALRVTPNTWQIEGKRVRQCAAYPRSIRLREDRRPCWRAARPGRKGQTMLKYSVFRTVPLLLGSTLALALPGIHSQAQVEPAPSADGEPVVLAYKHQPGQVQRTRVTTRSDQTLTAEGAAQSRTL